MDYNEAFGRVIRDWRLERMLTQEALAFQISLDRSFVSMLERGKASPSLNTIVALATAFDVAPSVLIARCEEKVRNG